MRDWLSFWNSPNKIYVNDRHRDVHYRQVAEAIRGFVPGPQARVIDYGCGEAPSANMVAAACARLILSDAAPVVREALAKRFADTPNVTVLAPEDVAALPAGCADLIVMNSVAQYLSRAMLDDLLAVFRRLLAPGGRLVIGDVIPPQTSVLTEVAALMKLARDNGFLLAAVGGLARTLFSEYRSLRTSLGLANYTEAEFMAVLAAAGFRAERHFPNIEHNQQRMTFVARAA